MAAKMGNRFFSAILTTLIAPVTTTLVVHKLESEQENAQQSTPAQQTANTSAAEEQLIAEGAGWTSEEALQQALRTALRNTAMSIVAPEIWARQGPALFDALLRDNAGLILDVKDLKSSEGWQTGRKVFYRTVAVSLARRAIAKRLTAAAAG